MTKLQIQLAWSKAIKETHKIPDWNSFDRNSKQYKMIVTLRELLLFCQTLLGKIEAKDNTEFNTVLFKKTFSFYCTQIKKYV